MAEHQGSRDEYQGTEVPPEKGALGLVKAILEQADPNTVNLAQPALLVAADVAVRIGVIQGLAIRLRDLLAERDALIAALLADFEGACAHDAPTDPAGSRAYSELAALKVGK